MGATRPQAPRRSPRQAFGGEHPPGANAPCLTPGNPTKLITNQTNGRTSAHRETIFPHTVFGTRPGRDSTWAEHRASRAAGELSRSTSHGWRRTSERSFTDFSVVETELGVVCTSFRGAERDFRRGVTGFRGMKRGFRGMKSDFRAALSDFSVMETCFRPMKSNFRTIDQRLLSGRK
jgi:hypothetical protein